jgi:RNA polymerase sigma factor (sigma-70 family)
LIGPREARRQTSRGPPAPVLLKADRGEELEGSGELRARRHERVEPRGARLHAPILHPFLLVRRVRRVDHGRAKKSAQGRIGGPPSWHYRKKARDQETASMPLIRNAGAAPDFRVLFGMGTLAGLTDGQLLERFATHRDDAGELAFAALLDRHGPMVLGVCGALLGDPNDAEDALQATFLVLARKARSLWVRDTIGPWLHAVAHRIASHALSDRARRRRHERAAAGRTATTTAIGPAEPDEIGPVLHDEIGRLPESFRAPIVLCYLEGLTHDQAAHRLGWPVGTVRSRLSRGRDRLRDRLERRGVAPAVALAPAAIAAAGRAGAAIRPSLAVTTTRAAARITTGMATTGTGPAAIALTKGVLRMMLLKTMLKVAATVVATGLLATGAVAVAYQTSGPGQETTTAPEAKARAIARPAAPAKSEAETIAEKFLKAGSDLFDAKDAAGLAATYTEQGEVLLVSKKDGEIKEDVKSGRAEIEQLYRDIFKDQGALDSENTVEFARLISPDLLVVHGRFRPDVGKPEWPFVQMRVKQGDRWLMSKLWLFLSPGRES